MSTISRSSTCVRLNREKDTVPENIARKSQKVGTVVTGRRPAEKSKRSDGRYRASSRMATNIRAVQLAGQGSPDADVAAFSSADEAEGYSLTGINFYIILQLAHVHTRPILSPFSKDHSLFFISTSTGKTYKQ